MSKNFPQGERPGSGESSSRSFRGRDHGRQGGRWGPLQEGEEAAARKAGAARSKGFQK